MAIPSDERLVEQVKEQYQQSEDALKEWRFEARELYDMVAGHQWSAEDRLKLEEDLRPIVTFNLASKFLDAIGGLQSSNRQQIQYFGRELGDASINEILTGTAEWVRDSCDAEDEESDAFMDVLICGVGWMEMSIDYEEDAEGSIVEERRDPLEMYWDHRSTKKNLRDRRWQVRVRWMLEQEVVERWGQSEYDAIVGTMGVEPEIWDADIHHATEAWKYEHDSLTRHVRNRVPVLHYEWFTKDRQVEVTTKYGKKTFTLNQWSKMKDVLDKNKVLYRAAKLRKKRYYRAFLAGERVLEKGESPYQEGFTFQAITGKRDRNRNTWYGVGRAARDPQLWTNKFFSQILHVLNTNAKGGLIAEEGAFADPSKAEAEWARPDSITYVEDGVIAEKRIMPKPAAQYPQGLDRLMEFSVNALPETIGLNMELIGFANRVQPGIVEAQRKEAAMTVITWAFDAMRRYYKDAGRQLAVYIRDYISDGRLARIKSDIGHKYIQLIRQDTTIEYDVIVDEAPTSTNMKEKVWGVLIEMMPSLLKVGAPIPPEILDYSPLPTELAQKWKQMMMKAMQAKENPEAAKMLKKEKEADTFKAESTGVLNIAKAHKVGVEAGKTMAGG